MRVIVVGAGVLGASTAYHLARAGAEVVVVDQAHPGRATAAGAGIVCPWASDDSDRAFHALYVAGGRYYGELVVTLAEGGETELGFRRNGALLVSDDPDDLAAFAAVLRRRRAANPEMGEIDRLDPRETRALFPPLAPGLHGLRIGGGARVDGRRLTASLLRAAQRQGARLQHGEAMLAGSPSRVTGIRLADQTLRADLVVVTAGAWAPALLAPFGIALPIRPQRGQIVHLRLPDAATGAWPVILPPGSHYLLAFEEGRIVAGATRESGAGFDHRVTAGGQAEVLNEALRTAPGLADATVLETRVGFRPSPPDGRPLLGTTRGLEGLLVGNGLGAAGLTIGPFAGRLLAAAALDHAPELDLSPFDPLRPCQTTSEPPALR